MILLNAKYLDMSILHNVLHFEVRSLKAFFLKDPKWLIYKS